MNNTNELKQLVNANEKHSKQLELQLQHLKNLLCSTSTPNELSPTQTTVSSLQKQQEEWQTESKQQISELNAIQNTIQTLKQAKTTPLETKNAVGTGSFARWFAWWLEWSKKLSPLVVLILIYWIRRR